MNILPFIAIIEDLNRELSTQQRYQRLVENIQEAIPCEAIVLLKLETGYLQAVAAIGLKDEAMARRFALEHHPRLHRIVQSSGLIRFDADSELADPYDGLVDNDHPQLLVHDCMGSAITIDGKIWGVLTLDAMQPGSFDQYDPIETRAYIAAVAAAINTSQHIDFLAARAEHQHEIAQRLMETDAEPTLIGQSKSIRLMEDEIHTVAPSDLSVLITGETGVGKELVAKSIHHQSRRREEALVQINCAALPESIVESELFGHIKGAFSGATQDRAGRFELADGGSLFLDEVGELSLKVQAKLLRALQNGEIQRVGSDQILSCDVRIIAATNRNLQDEVKQGRFRADLYHRLSVYPLLAPPLRDRGNDYALLAGHFLEEIQHTLGCSKLRLSPRAQVTMSQYDWPGNVRELKHLLDRAALKAAKGKGRSREVITIDSDHLDIQISQPENPASQSRQSGPGTQANDRNYPSEALELGLRDASDLFQKQFIEIALEENNYKLSATARCLKLDRSNLIRLMSRLGIEKLN